MIAKNYRRKAHKISIKAFKDRKIGLSQSYSLDLVSSHPEKIKSIKTQSIKQEYAYNCLCIEFDSTKYFSVIKDSIKNSGTLNK